MNASELSEALAQAVARLREGACEEAVEQFSACLVVAPADPRAYRGRGMAHVQLQQWPQAIADFSKAKELDSSEPEHWIGLATSLAMDHKVYEALGVFEAFLADHPQHVRARLQLAQLYYRLGAIPKGHRELDLALAARPTLSERRAIEALKREQLTLDKRRYARPDFEALNPSRPLTPEAQARRTFILKRGVLGVGLPVALLMALTVGFQVPGTLTRFQGFNPRTFVLGLLLFLPVFAAAGYVWGAVVYRFLQRKPSR